MDTKEIRQGDPEPWFWLAQVETQRDRIGEAIVALESAKSVNSKVWWVHDQLSELYQRQGDNERALTAARRAAQLLPDQRLQKRVMDLESFEA
jgi:cytochrome c-type biogenesis protein CcmH/NrfG